MKKKIKKSAQDIQYEVFRKMSADRKIEIASILSQLVVAFIGGKIDYKKPLPEAYFKHIYRKGDSTVLDLKVVIPR